MVNEVGEECGEYDDKRGKDSPTLQANVRTGHSPISLESSQLVVGSSIQTSTVTHRLSRVQCPALSVTTV